MRIAVLLCGEVNDCATITKSLRPPSRNLFYILDKKIHSAYNPPIAPHSKGHCVFQTTIHWIAINL